MSRKLILKNGQSPGDILMLTAAVRDLHHCYPGEFETDVRTPCPDLWLNNPHLTALDEDDPEVAVIDCHYPLVHRSNQSPNHFLSGFTEFLNQELDLQIRTTQFRGDIHLSDAERAAPSRVAGLIGADVPYWIVVAGGKYDFTIKWWHFRRYQEVVNALEDEAVFVQVGEEGHYHPQLHGALDLIGKTSLRELVQLVSHAQGVVCPVTFLMHLAAATPGPDGKVSQRAGVIIAGGRESPHWEAYPWHQFIHTVGALSCCKGGGCWRSRTLPLDDGDGKDDPSQLCVDVVGDLPRCMDIITSDKVVRRIRDYFDGGALPRITADERRAVLPHLVPSLRDLYDS